MKNASGTLSIGKPNGKRVGINGTALFEARIARGLTLKDVAVAVQASQTTWRRWELGLSNPPPELVPKMARVVGVSARRLKAS